ncbi:MAG: hypothetical protein IKA72_02430 [Clostridia bacterium]|nr:hypothetical protein [Clostridia bacterium]
MEYVIFFILGVLCCVIGGINTTGNISTVKYRQRRRVAPENRKAFGVIVGIGMIIIGISFIVAGILLILAEKQLNPVLENVAGISIIVGAVVGLVLQSFATIKYNKGIF